MRLYSLGRSFLLTALVAQLGAQQPPFRLVPGRVREPRVKAPGFPSFADAVAAAKQRQTNLLLFFTAKWCGHCRQVEDETLPAPEVQKELGQLTLARLDIDAAENGEVCRRYLGCDVVPTFVVLTASGAELHRWVGASWPTRFVEQLRQAPPDSVRPSTGPRDRLAALVEFHLRRNEPQEVAQHLDALEQLDSGRGAAALEGALWACCLAARQRRDWPALLAAARRYLALPAPPRAAEGQTLLGIAEFETTGRLSHAMEEYVDTRISALATPPPGNSVVDRVQRVLGQARPGIAVKDWVDLVNTAMHELTEVGRPAAASLRELLLGSRTGSRHAAVVLGRMRLPETAAWLVDRLRDRSTPAWARPHLVLCLGLHYDARCLPALLSCLGEENPPAVRASAAAAIKKVAVLADGEMRQDIADAMTAALDSNDLDLREEVLQALFEVHAPVSLETLLEVLSDRRALGWDEYRICDNALWILMKQLGMKLVRNDGAPVDERCIPEIAEYLRRWHAENGPRLRWDPDRAHYAITGK